MFIGIILGPLWTWQNLWGYGRKVHAKFWRWGMLWDPSYHHLWVPCCHPTCKCLLMKCCQLGRMAISMADCWSLISELVTRNLTMAIPALEDGLFKNLLILYYLYVLRYLCKGKGREGEGRRGREGHLLRHPLDRLKLIILIILGALWVYQTLWRHTRKHRAKFSHFGTPWGSR